ncbi:hypothetical protein HUJ05_000786 [Dendroctonus ponderosae]|nr:hypothetical protein HUJ05_000786 [Dendroctonus ponderosae]
MAEERLTGLALFHIYKTILIEVEESRHDETLQKPPRKDTKHPRFLNETLNQLTKQVHHLKVLD